MPHKLLNLTLLTVAIVGVVFAYRVAKRHRELSAEHQRLEAMVGSLPIGDPSKIHVRAIDTGEELHFAWRVYVPGGIRVKWQHGTGSGTSMNSQARHIITRVCIREQDDGTLYVFLKRGGGSSCFQVGDRALADVLRDRWGEIQVEQLASDDIRAVDRDEVATLLRLTLPDDMKQEAEEKVRPSIMRDFKTALLDIRFGTDQAFQRAAAREELGQ
jgi:hypothetical protein